MLRVDGGLSSLLAVALGSESRLVHFIIHFIMTGQAFFFFEPNVRALGLALVRRKSTDNGNSDRKEGKSTDNSGNSDRKGGMFTPGAHL